MKRNPFLLLAIIVLAVSLLVSCDSSDEPKVTLGMTEYYSVAREAFRLSTGITLPELSGLGLTCDLYHEELEFLKDIVKDGGSNDFTLGFNLGVTSEAYDKIIAAISAASGDEREGYPQYDDKYHLDGWKKDDLTITSLYQTDNEWINIKVDPSL